MATPGRLVHLGLLRFSGADAAAFLQGQVSNDTAALERGSTVRCALSTPQGRVVAILTLLPHSSGVLGILPRELLAPTAQRLARFILRSKVRIEDVSAEFFVAGQHGASGLAEAGLSAPGAPRAYVESQGIGVARLDGTSERFWVVGPGGDHSWLITSGSALIQNCWRLADVRDGLPQVYLANCEEFVAQMLNLDLVDGISFTKGCYTGQEIIARTQHRGHVKRRMFRVAVELSLATPDTMQVGAPVRLADGRSGRICEYARCDSGFEALAILPLAPTGAPADATGVAATLLDLPYALSAGANSTSTLSSSTIS